MKRYLPFVLSLAFALCHAHGQYGAPKDDSDDKEQAQAPEEIPDFNNLDEYTYQPKSTLNYGLRFMAGPKVKFGGSGNVVAPSIESVTDLNTPNIYRIYHDGAVDPDGRTLAIGTGSGTGNVPAGGDGKTNTWTYTDPTQLTSDDFMQMHSYSAKVTSIDPLGITAKSGMGAELFNAMDMGKLGKHMKWSIFGGVSLSGINGATYTNENATMTTITDTYNLFGQTPGAATPGAPYSSPSTTTDTITTSGGSTETATVNSSTLISNTPVERDITTSQVFVTDHFKLSGEYFTIRGGPQLEYDFTEHLKALVSVGPALVYAGTNLTATEVLVPTTGLPIVDNIGDGTSVFRLGEYADATLEYDLTDTTGFYFGAFYQNAGTYTEHIYDPYGSNYSSNVNLNDQQGLRTGMSYRF
jgi:hypothetical protein